MQPPRRKQIFIGFADLLERLAHRYGCQIHLFSQRVEGVPLGATKRGSAERGAIIWHKVPTFPGPHIAQFLAWLVLNNLVRTAKRVFGACSFDLLLSPGINTLHADVVIVHALFHSPSPLFPNVPQRFWAIILGDPMLA